MNRSLKAIVIGSGVAGLATATRLACKGFRVSVFEKNNYPGGKLSAFKNNGYHFDAGPSLFTQPAALHELFELAGEPIQNYFSYQRLPVACNYFFENGKTFVASANAEKLAQELEEAFGEAQKNTTQYLSNAEKLYNGVGEIFLDHSLHKIKTWLSPKVLKALATVLPAYLQSSLHAHNSNSFKTAEATQIFNRYATYNGSNPYQAPAMLSLIPHLEYNEGTYYPDGGMISITNALYELAKKKGVQFYFDSPVQRIIHAEGSAKGVVVNGKNALADVIVANADIYFTYKNLLQQPLRANRVLKQQRSSSALVFYWGIKKEFSQLGLHNIFFSADYKSEFTHIFKGGSLHPDPTVYINITSKHDKGHAPAGRENWFVMINAPANIGQNWAAFQQQARAAILGKLSRLLAQDIEGIIEAEEMLNPVLIEERTGSYMGSLYGTSSNSRMAAFLRHPNFSSFVKNLYCVGGSVHPGGGIPLCFKSAKIAAGLIEENKGLHSPAKN